VKDRGDETTTLEAARRPGSNLWEATSGTHQEKCLTFQERGVRGE
jgi:hypothetical protein